MGRCKVILLVSKSSLSWPSLRYSVVAGISGTFDLDALQDPQQLEQGLKVLASDKDNAGNHTGFNMS